MKTSFVVALALLFFVGEGSAAQILSSPNLTDWGTWGSWERCSPGAKVISFQIQVEPWDAWDGFTDDSCMNSIKFVCGDPATGIPTQMITSKQGPFGRYRNMHYCPTNSFAVGFMLRVVEDETALVDDTATNNLRILCFGSTTGYMELDGENWGQWTNPRACSPLEYICGLQTQVQDNQGVGGDDTALNNIKVECCDLSKEDLVYYGLKM